MRGGERERAREREGERERVVEQSRESVDSCRLIPGGLLPSDFELKVSNFGFGTVHIFVFRSRFVD